MLTAVARRRRVTVIRSGLLALLLSSVVGIGALLLFGRAGQPQRAAAAASLAAEELPQDVVVAGEGSGFDITDGERTVFRIRAARTRADRAETVSLERVEIDLPRGDRHYLIRADQARINRESRHALLEGNVVVEGPDGAGLQTDWLELRESGNLLAASQGTRFSVRDLLTGTARTLHVHLERQLMLASGGVEIESQPSAPVPFAVRADTVRIDRGQRLLRAEGAVEARRGFDPLKTRRLTLRLDEFSDRIRYVRALWGVEGSFETEVSEGTPRQRIVFSGETLSLYFQPETEALDALELEGLPRRLASIEARDPGGAFRLLEGRLILASFTAGRLASADVMGPLKVHESAPSETGGPALERLATAEGGAQATFDSDGGLVKMKLEGNVALRDGSFVAQGATATIDGAAGAAELTGTPAWVTTERGRLSAPRITHQRSSGMLRAHDGVRAQLVATEDGRGALPWASEGGEPLRVEAGEALLAAGEDGEFVFRTAVRAWQGKKLVLAEQLRGNQDGSRLAASGGVKTLWQSAAQPAGETGATAGEPEAPAGPIEVIADTMDYGDSERQIHYRGNVKAVQLQRVLECAEMAVELSAQQEAERLRCSGGTRLTDAELARTIDGARAVYDLRTQEIEFFGAPIVLHDPQRGEVRARGLRYHLETGALRMGPGEPEEAPAPAAAAPAPTSTTGSGRR